VSSLLAAGAPRRAATVRQAARPGSHRDAPYGFGVVRPGPFAVALLISAHAASLTPFAVGRLSLRFQVENWAVEPHCPGGHQWRRGTNAKRGAAVALPRVVCAASALRSGATRHLARPRRRARYTFFFFGFPFRKPAFSWAFRVLCLRRSLRNLIARLWLHDFPPICALRFFVRIAPLESRPASILTNDSGLAARSKESWYILFVSGGGDRENV
jgi:hypothetical protein